MLIVLDILEAIAGAIQKSCIEDLVGYPAGKPNSPYMLSEVKIGRYQQDPAISMFRVAVTHGDLEDSSYEDGIFKRLTTNQKTLAYNTPSREIGGGETWLRRGTCRIELFFLGRTETEDEIRRIAYNMVNNVFFTVADLDVSGISVDREEASQIFAVTTEMLQTGGPGSWIYRGKIYWEVQTELL